MENRDQYRDIAPYYGKDFEEALKRFLTEQDKLVSFAAPFLGGKANMDKVGSTLAGAIAPNLDKINDYLTFQQYITAGIAVPMIVKGTMTSFTYSGLENIDRDKSYLYITTHRDIVLDCMLTDYALYLADKPRCQMAFGDNLMKSQYIEDLLRLNGGIIVKRDLPMREKYKESIRLSKYFVETITEDNRSVWVAQRSGRSKDALDETQPAIIKMLYLSKRGEGISFPELMKKVRIVPAAISYQYNPNDINISREEIATIEKGGYTKKKYEDVVSMVRGLKGQKGHVHISFGTPLEGEYEDANAVAREIDRQIHLSYKLWNTNWFAYDHMEGKDGNKDKYADLDTDAFLGRLSHLSPSVRNYVLNSYANPVRSYLREKAEA